MTNMTKAQKKAVEVAREVILEHDGLQRVSNDYEYKRFEISQVSNTNIIQLLTEVGRVGDEGTLAQWFCRVHRQIFIGPRGGYQLANAARYVTYKNGTSKKVAKKGYITGKRALTHLTTDV